MIINKNSGWKNNHILWLHEIFEKVTWYCAQVLVAISLELWMWHSGESYNLFLGKNSFPFPQVIYRWSMYLALTYLINLIISFNVPNKAYCFLVYDRNHYFGFGPIPKPTPKMADNFGRYLNRYRNYILKGESSYR